MSFEDWKPEHGPKTVHEVIQLLSSDPDPDELMMDEVLMSEEHFPFISGRSNACCRR